MEGSRRRSFTDDYTRQAQFHRRRAEPGLACRHTYIETDQGWLYLATIMDLYSRKIVGWAMADHLRTELPLTALAMAIARQRPGAGLIHHSDRGVHTPRRSTAR